MSTTDWPSGGQTYLNVNADRKITVTDDLPPRPDTTGETVWDVDTAEAWADAHEHFAINLREHAAHLRALPPVDSDAPAAPPVG